MIDDLKLEYDGPDGYSLTIDDDDDSRVRTRRITEEALYTFLDSAPVKAALDHREDGRREREAYDRATPAERREVLGQDLIDEALVDPLEEADLLRDRNRDQMRGDGFYR